MKTNKELKEEYLRMRFPAGVFQIRNTVNGKLFIGSSMNLESAWNSHHAQLRFGSHRNEALQADWNQYGEQGFVYEIIAELKQQEEEDDHTYKKELKLLEEMYLAELQPYEPRGYHRRSQQA